MKYVHIENNRLLGWYSEDIHGTWIEPVYEDKIIEEQRDEEGNIVQEEIIEKVLVKEGYYDISNIPTPNIIVTDEVWQEALNINANWYEDDVFSYKDLRTLKEIEEARINSIKAKAGELIYSKYSQEKQLNIGRLATPYTEEDREEMYNYIDNIRRISNEAEENGTALEDIDWELENG